MYEIYGTDSCKFCIKAKELLVRYHKEYTFIDVIKNDDIFAAFSKKFPNVNRIPQIVLGEEHIGGYRELEKSLTLDEKESII